MDTIYTTPMPMLPPFRVTSMVSILAEVLDYNHKLMNIPAMWRSTKGAPVKVVVLDTGLPQHVDIGPAGSKSFIGGYLADQNGHSTHVGGILAAIADNGMGIAGVAPDCRDYYGAVLDGQGSGTIEAIIKGIRWAVDEIGAQVINMSLGIDASAPRLKALEDACNYANAHGCVVVAAAGNENGPVGQPAQYDSVIAVAAIDQNQKHAWFSNTGPQVDFATGGVKVYSTWLKNGYAKLDGTSMASPALAGVVALIMADHYKTAGKWLTPKEVYQRLSKIAFDVGPDGFDEEFGHGIPVFKYDEAPSSGSDVPPTEEPVIPPVPQEPPAADPPAAPAPNIPCDCSAAFPMIGEFLNSAARSLESDKSVQEAIVAGLLAGRDCWERIQAVRGRHARKLEAIRQKC
jgi:subtilisin